MKNPDEIEVMFIDWKRGIDFNIADIDFRDVICVRNTLTEIAIKSPQLVRAILAIAQTVIKVMDDAYIAATIGKETVNDP